MTNAHIKPSIPIDLSLVPEELHHLAQMAERWGTMDQGRQDKELAKLISLGKPAEVLRQAFVPIRQQLVEWAEELHLHEKRVSDITEADWRNPYWLFLSTLKVAQNIPVAERDRSPENLRAIDRMRAEINHRQMESDKANAHASFSSGDYSAAAKLLEKWENALSAAEAAKLKYCRKKTELHS